MNIYQSSRSLSKNMLRSYSLENKNIYIMKNNEVIIKSKSINSSNIFKEEIDKLSKLDEEQFIECVKLSEKIVRMFKKDMTDYQILFEDFTISNQRDLLFVSSNLCHSKFNKDNKKLLYQAYLSYEIYETPSRTTIVNL